VLTHTAGGGDQVGIIATEELVARLVALTICREGGGGGGERVTRGCGRVALARGYLFGGTFRRQGQGQDGGRRGHDVQMADAKGSAGDGSHGAGSPDRLAGSVASGDSWSRRARSSAEDGLDMRNGGARTGYPDEAEDQEAERPLLEEARPSPIRQACFSSPSLAMRDAVPVMSDNALMDAATNDSRLALVRIEQDHLGTPPGLIDVLADVPDDLVDAIVAEVHGNANYGNRGEVRQAYEVLACFNEFAL